jgi:hypothetical protein
MDNPTRRKPLWPILLLFVFGLCLCVAGVLFASWELLFWTEANFAINQELPPEKILQVKQRIRDTCWMAGLPGMAVFTGTCCVLFWQRVNRRP